MSSAICTLFEGNYHYGVAGLVNSLCKYGFRGSVFAGFRGEMPVWAIDAQEILNSPWDGAKILRISDKINLYFIPVNTKFHLTNFKPYFMVELLQNAKLKIDSLTYFDPDIVIKCNWSFFENWMNYGVSLVHEIIANDMPPTHPLRQDWEKVIKLSDKTKTRELHSYINGGFCSVKKENIEFLETWKIVFETGIKYFNLSVDQWNHSYDRSYMFYAQDQDALNITAMCSQSPISEMGPEAMDFIPGGTVMSHAVGSNKPWKKQFIKSALMGFPPSMVDKMFWSNVRSPLMPFTKAKIGRKAVAIRIASLIGRFQRRN